MKARTPFIAQAVVLALAALCACSPDIDDRKACKGDQDCFRKERCDLARHQCVAIPPGGFDAGFSDTVLDTANGGDTALPDTFAPVDAFQDVAAVEDAGMDAGKDVASDAGEDSGSEPTGDADIAPDVPTVVDALQDASAPDTSTTPDVGPDVQAPPAKTMLEIGLTLTILSADKDSFLDIGFCPNPSKQSPTPPGQKVPCPDAVFVHIGRPLVGGLEVAAHTSVPGGEPKSSDPMLLPGSTGVFDIVLKAPALPDSPTTPVPLSISVKSGGKELEYLTYVPTENLGKFGVWNLNTSTVPETCLATLATSVSGQISDLIVSLNEVPVQVANISQFELEDPKGGAFQMTDGTLSFAISSCIELWLLTTLDFGAGQ